MMKRIIGSVVLLVLVGWINFLLNPFATLLSGQIAGSQFNPSDASYVTSQYGMAFYASLGVPVAVVLFGLLVIWWPYVAVLWRAAEEGNQPSDLERSLGMGEAPRQKSGRGTKRVAAILFCLIAFGASRSQAYYQTTEVTEAYTILPNESAFWIPDVGDNKTSQTQLDSEAYLTANKLAVKRFVIPHAKLGNSGGWLGADAYVPTGRLIIVDRTPYSHEWVKAATRGTSAKDESFPCQTKEGLNITAGVSIGASVAEANAAKFLYRFGVNPPQGDRWNKEVIFTSVYYGRSLYNVMADIGRKKIQTLVCEQIAARTFDQANTDTNAIMDSVRKDAIKFFDGYGITVEFLGWADTFEFDDAVQKVVNDYYAVAKLGPQVQMLQALTQLKVQEGLGTGLSTHGLPIVVTPDMINALIGMVKPSAVPAGK